MGLGPMMAAEGEMMIDCVQGFFFWRGGGFQTEQGETEGKLGFKYSTG